MQTDSVTGSLQSVRLWSPKLRAWLKTPGRSHVNRFAWNSSWAKAASERSGWVRVKHTHTHIFAILSSDQGLNSSAFECIMSSPASTSQFMFKNKSFCTSYGVKNFSGWLISWIFIVLVVLFIPSHILNHCRVSLTFKRLTVVILHPTWKNH